MVVDLIAVVHLRGVELALACDGIGAVYALDGALFVLIGVSPWYWPGPVEIGLDGVSLSVLLDLEGLVASECRVGETLADDRVAHPEHELLVFRVGDFSLVHPEGVDADTARAFTDAGHGVVGRRTHGYGAAVHEHHAVGDGLGERCSAHSGDLAAACAAARAGAGGEDPDGHRNGAQQCRRRPELHVSGICFC